MNSETKVMENNPIDSIKNPVPKWIKFGLPSFFIVLAVTAMFVVSSFSDDTDVVFSESELAELTGASEEQSQDNTASPVVSAIDSPVMSNSITQNITDSVDYSELEANFESLKNELGAANDLLNKYKNKFGDIGNSIYDITTKSIPSLVNSDAAIQRKISDLYSKVGNHDSRLKEKERVLADKPPFYLLSIDRWDVITSAVLGFDGQTAIATVCDVRAGWKIDSIILPNCIKTLRVSDNKSFKLCAS